MPHEILHSLAVPSSDPEARRKPLCREPGRNLRQKHRQAREVRVSRLRSDNLRRGRGEEGGAGRYRRAKYWEKGKGAVRANVVG